MAIGILSESHDHQPSLVDPPLEQPIGCRLGQRIYHVSQYIQLRQDYDTRSGTSARMSDRFAPVRMGVAIVTQALLGGCSPVAGAFGGVRATTQQTSPVSVVVLNRLTWFNRGLAMVYYSRQDCIALKCRPPGEPRQGTRCHESLGQAVCARVRERGGHREGTV